MAKKRRDDDDFGDFLRQHSAVRAARVGGDLEAEYWQLYDEAKDCGDPQSLKNCEVRIKCLNAIAAHRRDEQLPRQLREAEARLDEVERKLAADHAGIDDSAGESVPEALVPTDWQQ